MSAERSRAVLALVVVMFFWGTSAVFLRTTALTLAPENALALRYLVLVALFGVGLALVGDRWIGRADWPRLAAASLAGMFGSSWFTMQGFARVAAGLGTVVQMIEPILIAMLAAVLLGEALTRRVLIGLGVCLVGGLVLFWPDVTAAAERPVDPLGVVALVLASACFAAQTILAKPLLARHSSFTVTAWVIILAAVPVLALASRPIGELVATTSAATWAEILYLAVFNSLLGNVLWTYATHRLPGATVGAFLYLMPVFAVAAGFLWLGEPVTAHLVAGGAILLAGVAIAQSRPERR